MSDFKELLNNEHAKKLMNDHSAMEHLKTAPETQKLMEKLNRQVGGDLDSATDAAANGDPAQLMKAMQALLHDPESKQLLEQISRSLPL